MPAKLEDRKAELEEILKQVLYKKISYRPHRRSHPHHTHDSFGRSAMLKPGAIPDKTFTDPNEAAILEKLKDT